MSFFGRCGSLLQEEKKVPFRLTSWANGEVDWSAFSRYPVCILIVSRRPGLHELFDADNHQFSAPRPQATGQDGTEDMDVSHQDHQYFVFLRLTNI